MSIMCLNETMNNTFPLINGENYRPELVFNFSYIGNDTANDYILDWMELIWSAYFALFFGSLGSHLKRCKHFVFQMRIFGFYSVWTGIRLNPGFVDAVIFERLMRCILSAILGATTSIMIHMEELIELYTILTVGSGHLINLFDPWLRREGGCQDIGPPTTEFPYGVWEDCSDWKIAYAVTWANTLFVYLIVGIVVILVKCFKIHKKIPFFEPLKRHTGFIAVSMIATSSAVTFLTSLTRREKIHDKHFDTFLQWSYYILLALFFLVQELIDRVMICRENLRKLKQSVSLLELSLWVQSKRLRLESYCCSVVKLVSMIFWGLSMPLYLPELTVKILIQKIVDINAQKLAKEDEKNRRTSKEIVVEDYWKTEAWIQENKSAGVQENKSAGVQENKSTEVEKVVGAPSKAKKKSGKMKGEKIFIVNDFVNVEQNGDVGFDL